MSESPEAVEISPLEGPQSTGKAGDPLASGLPKKIGNRFQPGKSGNPGGRPRAEREVRELARKYGPRAVRRLVSLMRSKNERVAVAAASALLDRAYGKPFQGIGNPDGSALTPSNVLIGVMAGEPISDAERASLVYAEVLGRPTIDTTAITFTPPVTTEPVSHD